MSTQLDRTAVAEVADLAQQAAKPEVLEIDGIKYTTKQVFSTRKKDPVPEALQFRTLQSFADYVSGEVDEDYRKEHRPFIHVVRPTLVVLRSALFGTFRQRTDIASADAIVPPIAFGRWTDPASFNILLQTHFVDGANDRSRVLSLVGNLRSEAVQTIDDDGVTQGATVSRAMRLGEEKVPNPVHLRPRRTFPEITQPESPFVLRLTGGSETALPQCALFEADGGQWELAAIDGIKAWLADNVESEVPIYG